MSESLSLSGGLTRTANGLLIDPPEVLLHAARGDPPMKDWPGEVVKRLHLMQACGDKRDWFRYGHRYLAYKQVLDEFVDARRKRDDYSKGFDFDQVLIIGPFGTKKSTLGILASLPWFRQGHAVFADCAALFGWRLGPDEVHTAMGFMPSNAVLLRDEASATMASRLGHGVAVATAGEMNLNTRKKNCKVFYMSAKDRKIALDIRLDCKQVWRPVGDKDLIIEGETSTGYDPAENPDNFRIVYHVWDDFPYQQADLIEGKAADHYGLGRPPDYTAYDEGENVRLAYLLNDTFELARAGAATMADRDGIKEQLASFHAGTGPVRGNGVPAADPKQLQLLAFLQEHEQNPPEYFRPGEIAKALGVHPTAAGQVVQQLGHVPNVQRKGYPSELMYAYLDELLENAQ